MSVNVILLANGLTALGMLMLFISTQLSGKKSVLGVQCLNHVFSGTGTFLLGGYSGVMQDVVSIARNLTVMAGIQNTVLNSAYVVIGIVLGLAFNNLGPVGLLPMIANAIYAVAVVHPRGTDRSLKVALAISTTCWIIYNAVLLNVVGTVANTINALSTLVYLWRTRPGRSGQTSAE